MAEQFCTNYNDLSQEQKQKCNNTLFSKWNARNVAYETYLLACLEKTRALARLCSEAEYDQHERKCEMLEYDYHEKQSDLLNFRDEFSLSNEEMDEILAIFKPLL